MKKIISFSLYGDKKIYLHGALRNAELASFFYPGWISRFYVGPSVPKSIVQDLKSLNSEVLLIDRPENNLSSFWRFFAFADDDVDIVLVRDTDSRFSQREVSAVSAWLETGSTFHIMRDHPFHSAKIMAGMWGARAVGLRDILHLIQHASYDNIYGSDQFFLRKYIYPRCINDSCVHASYYLYESSAVSFPHKRINGEFVGERFDENDIFFHDDRIMLSRYDNSIFLRFFHNFKIKTKGILIGKN